MNGKQQTLTPKSLIISSLVAASASFGAIVAAPLSAKAQNSPVTTTPTSPVGTTTTVLDFNNLLGGTETSTTTTTTTTQEGTTTTTTTTTTSETTSTTEVSSTQETTQVSTSEETSGSTTSEIATEGLESVPVSPGLEATTGVSEQTTTSTETIAIVISLSQQYATATGIDAAFISDLARQLGIDGDILVGTLVFDKARGLQGNKQAAMEAFINALKRAGVFEIGAFDNETFAELFGSYATAEQLAAVFNGLSEGRILLIVRIGNLEGFRFRLAQQGITLVQFIVWKGTGDRAITFPPARGSNNQDNNRDED